MKSWFHLFELLNGMTQLYEQYSHLSIYEKDAKKPKSEASRKAIMMYRMEIENISEMWEDRLKALLESPECEIQKLRDQLAQAKSDHSNAKILWDQKLNNTVQELTALFHQRRKTEKGYLFLI